MPTKITLSIALANEERARKELIHSLKHFLIQLENGANVSLTVGRLQMELDKMRNKHFKRT